LRIATILFAAALLLPLSARAYEDKDTGSGSEPGNKVEVSSYGALTGADERQGLPSETARPGPKGTMSTQKNGPIEKKIPTDPAPSCGAPGELPVGGSLALDEAQPLQYVLPQPGDVHLQTQGRRALAEIDQQCQPRVAQLGDTT
jgi:hypothetical protein